MNENLTSIPVRKGAAVALGLTLVLTGVACSSSKKSSGTTGTTTAANQQLAAATLTASGSTFQQPFDNLAITGFTQKQPNITINYGGGGSGTGKTDLQNQVNQWSGTDSLIKDSDLSSYKGGKVLYFPTVVAPITVAYNLSGVSDLKLSAPTVAKIFATKITKWNDPAITADNPGVTLPSTTIAVVHRAEKSGTTSNFTKYLAKADPTDWTLGSSDAITWPGSTQSGSGNAGVAGKITGTPGAIGYVDYADALKAKLSFAEIKNAAGNFEKPTLDGAGKAVASAKVAPDLTYDPINAPGADAYPITSPTWIICYQKQTDRTKGEALKSFLDYILTTGQGFAKTANYEPLPTSLAQQAVAQLDTLQIPAS